MLMIDARNVYRKATRKIYDFVPEQEQNLLAIVWLYRGRTVRYLDLMASYCMRMPAEGAACFTTQGDTGENAGAKNISPLPDFIAALATMRSAIEPFLKTPAKDGPHAETLKELDNTTTAFKTNVKAFQKMFAEQQELWEKQKDHQRRTQKSGGTPVTFGRVQP